jgi:hypothetical protein
LGKKWSRIATIVIIPISIIDIYSLSIIYSKETFSKLGCLLIIAIKASILAFKLSTSSIELTLLVEVCGAPYQCAIGCNFVTYSPR